MLYLGLFGHVNQDCINTVIIVAKVYLLEYSHLMSKPECELIYVSISPIMHRTTLKTVVNDETHHNKLC